MDTQLNLTVQVNSKQIPTDHIKPDSYIDPNCCTLDDAVQQLSIDSEADTPFIIWLFEDPDSPIALPGKIDLYGHDCLHAILNRGHSLADEAFILGFCMGSATQTHWLHQLFFKFVSSTLYPRKYRFAWKDFYSFDVGFAYGRSMQIRNLNRLDFRIYGNYSIAQMRQQLGVSKAAEHN